MAIYDINGNALVTAYALDGTMLTKAYDIDGEQIFPDSPAPIEWLETAVVSALPSVSASGIKEGGCTDGTYIYQTVGINSNFTVWDIMKYKISDGTYTTKHFAQSDVDFGHANDMVYNPNNHRLYVPTMLDDGTVIVLDADDLSYIETLIIENRLGNPFRCWRLCFNRLTNEFVCPSNGYVYFYDQSLNFLRALSFPAQPPWTSQGCDTDGAYIYCLYYNDNNIVVYTIGGEYVTTIALPVSGEPEGMMYNWTNGEYYISRYVSSNIFSKVQLKA